MHKSDIVLDSIELIPLGPADFSPMFEAVKIKVFYLGTNRNGSYIDKPTALNMAKTLRGCPIVGYFKEEKDDFTDHGDVVTIDDQGVHFNCNTKPYGFVDLNAKIWFENYVDLDDFGNAVERTYLVTEGIVWVGQYPELEMVLKEGRPQSMELDQKTLQGHWTNQNNSKAEIFIINDAIFSKLCILGEDVEPCFEGAAITAPGVSSNFSRNDDFSKTLFNMVQELKELTFSLKDKGGTSMATENVNTVSAEENTAPAAENFSAEEGKNNSENTVENETNVEEFAKKEENKENKTSEDDKSSTGEDDDDAKENEDEEDKDKKNPKTKNALEEKFALLEKELNELKTNYEALQEQNKELTVFKNQVEDEKKNELINSFYMLSDEDKKDVIENKAKYSLEDIEAKLSIICVRKKVNFNTEDSDSKKEQPVITYNLNNTEADTLPAWLKAVENRRNVND